MRRQLGYRIVGKGTGIHRKAGGGWSKYGAEHHALLNLSLGYEPDIASDVAPGDKAEVVSFAPSFLGRLFVRTKVVETLHIDSGSERRQPVATLPDGSAKIIRW